MLTRFRRYLKMKRGFRTEWCWLVIPYMPGDHLLVNLYPDILGSVTPVSTSFDYQVVYDRENFFEDTIGFYHTHPPSLSKAWPSVTDIDTMTAWSTCLGKNLLCFIDNGWDISGYMTYEGRLLALSSKYELAIDPLTVHTEEYDGRIYTRGELQR